MRDSLSILLFYFLFPRAHTHTHIDRQTDRQTKHQLNENTSWFSRITLTLNEKLSFQLLQSIYHMARLSDCSLTLLTLFLFLSAHFCFFCVDQLNANCLLFIPLKIDSLLGDGFRLFTRVELRKKVYYRQFITMTTMYNFVLNQVGLFGVSFGFFLNPDLNFNYLITNTKKKKTKK